MLLLIKFNFYLRGPNGPPEHPFPGNNHISVGILNLAISLDCQNSIVRQIPPFLVDLEPCPSQLLLLKTSRVVART